MRLPEAMALLNPVAEFENRVIEVPGGEAGELSTAIDDFGFLWFEDEAVVAGSASWVVAGNAADAITRESK
jgi:hypothetical protein